MRFGFGVLECLANGGGSEAAPPRLRSSDSASNETVFPSSGDCYPYRAKCSGLSDSDVVVAGGGDCSAGTTPPSYSRHRSSLNLNAFTQAVSGTCLVQYESSYTG
ncbi:hypothetical protein TSMEX_008177 [Taenia solium]|eukprot:TsM_000394200 transcript=TsM_000394200 gene=TsM_000394200